MGIRVDGAALLESYLYEDGFETEYVTAYWRVYIGEISLNTLEIEKG